MAKQIKSNPEGFHVPEQADLDRANFQKMKDYYNVCLHPDRPVTAIYSDISYLQNTLLPVESLSADSLPMQLGTTLAFFTASSINSFIETVVTRNDLDHAYNTAFIKFPTVEEEPEEAIELIIGKALGNFNQSKHVLLASKSSNVSLWSQSEIKNAIKIYTGVQDKLQNITATQVLKKKKKKQCNTTCTLANHSMLIV